jgi:STAS-like domain of unknown function (DUF4325)
MNIDMFSMVGDFGEDKDAASNIRKQKIAPAVANGKTVVLDFTGVTLVTQSFVHALIANVLRVEGERVLDQLEFKGCSEIVKGIITTVVQYSLDSMNDDLPAEK